MAGISGAVACFLGPAIEVGKCIYEPMKRQLNYLCCFNNNIQNLRDEARKLEDTTAGLQMRVTTDENNAQVVFPEVKTWLKDATRFTQATMSEIEAQITSAQNLKSRYFLSRKATKTAEAMKEHRKSCDFSNISQPPPPAASAPIPLGSAHEFESRKHIEDEIMACLRDEVGDMVGICGMGGVGKTTMAKRIVHRAREEHLFDENVMTVVSQTVDLLKIQNDIAKSLGLYLEAGGTLFSNAHTLRTRLSTTTKKTLIVIDDIWDDLKLEELGIPCDSGCRVLLTSRDRDIFNRMNVDKVYALDVLSEIEAWHLFKSSVGGCDDNEDVVKKVFAECGGLPIALVTVGAGLKGSDKVKSIWEDALLQLKSANPIDLPKVVDKVYNPLRLSYKLLESVGAKPLFLMCCLYGEDRAIPLEDLTIYAMGLGMFEDITSLGEARNKVCSLVEMLKSHFLLLEGDGKDHVKMHDVVRDVATFIAKEEGRINSSACTWRSPFTGLRSKLLSGSNFPSLRLLLIDQYRQEDKELEMKDNFFEGMTELNVVSIEAYSLCVLPDLTALLKNLRALVLVGCRSLESVSVVGELADLEILICRRCYSIKSLSVEIGRLTSLRLLELSECRNLKTIAPGIISSMTSLEELVIKRSFDEWEAEAEEGGRKKVNAALSELESLSKLTRLEIQIKDSLLAAENIRLPPNIVKYDIAIGGRQYFDPYILDLKWRSKRKLDLNLRRDINLGNWLRTCVGSAEWVFVVGNGSGDLDLGVAQSLKCLVLWNFSTMKKLVNSGSSVFPLLEVLWVREGSEVEEICDIDGPMPLKNLKKITLEDLPKLEHLWKTADEHHIVSIFNNLSSIGIGGCHRLRSLFSLSKTAWGCFSQLENLVNYGCDAMEQVFLWNEKDDDKMVEFPKLKRLRLEYLPRLTSLCGGIENIEFPVLEEISIEGCPLLKNLASHDDEDADDDNCIHLFCKPDKVRFSSLKQVSINGEGVSSRNWIWCRQIPTTFFAQLHELSVHNCRGMKSLFLCSISRNLRSLKVLRIWSCEEMVTVIEDEEVENGETPLTPLFPNLETLYLIGLTNLKSFCEWRCPLELPSLRVLKIHNCICLDKFTSGLLITPNLETIYLNGKSLTVTDKDVNNALERYRIEIASEVDQESEASDTMELSQESEASDTMEHESCS